MRVNILVVSTTSAKPNSRAFTVSEIIVVFDIEDRFQKRPRGDLAQPIRQQIVLEDDTLPQIHDIPPLEGIQMAHEFTAGDAESAGDKGNVLLGIA